MKQPSTAALALLLGAVAAQPALSQDLTAGFASEPSSIDPLYHNLGPNNATRKHMFEALVDEDANLAIIPGLAESWETSEDGLTWTFNLREGVTFHDGKPVHGPRFPVHRLPHPECAELALVDGPASSSRPRRSPRPTR
jgi:peptide/nickel transport system substrate-binding protein